MIIGTSNFESLQAAVRYYKDYGLEQFDVELKIRNKEIQIGMPSPPPGFRVYLNKEEGRYFLEEIRRATEPTPKLGMSLSVRIDFPDKWGDGWEYTNRTYYDPYHAWAGQVKNTTEENEAYDALWTETQPSSMQHDPGGRLVWAEYELNSLGGINLQRELDELHDKVHAIVDRFPVREQPKEDDDDQSE